MAKKPTDRPATAAAVAKELKGVRQATRPLSALPVPEGEATAAVVEPVMVYPVGPAPQPPRHLKETLVESGTVRPAPQPPRRLNETLVEPGAVRAAGRPAPRSGWKWVAVGGAVAAVAVALVVALFVFPGSKASERTPGEILAVQLSPAVRMEFVWCPPGSFLMGSPDGEAASSDDKPQHRVTFTRGFYLGRTEVTQAQWQAVMGGDNNPSQFKGDDLPVETVSWNECVAFCKKMGERDSERRRFRLPSEAEWEYACRAGTTTPFSFGATITPDLVNYDGNFPHGGAPKGVYREKTIPVGSFPANAWGLREMHGNVWEWCADCYAPYPAGDQTDPPIVENSDNSRVLRGGSWDIEATNCRAAHRHRDDATALIPDVGFRVCLRPD